MPLNQDDKDEIRLLIVEEIDKAFKLAFDAALNAPISITDLSYASSSEGQQEREARKKVIREIRKSVTDSFHKVLSEAQAHVVEKTDPARAETIRRLPPAEF
jgi:hypothetical protein